LGEVDRGDNRYSKGAIAHGGIKILYIRQPAKAQTRDAATNIRVKISGSVSLIEVKAIYLKANVNYFFETMVVI
jgi:hypothetical protein